MSDIGDAFVGIAVAVLITGSIVGLVYLLTPSQSKKSSEKTVQTATVQDSTKSKDSLEVKIQPAPQSEYKTDEFKILYSETGSIFIEYKHSSESGNHEYTKVIVRKAMDDKDKILLYPWSETFLPGYAKITYEELPSGKILSNEFFDNYVKTIKDGELKATEMKAVGIVYPIFANGIIKLDTAKTVNYINEE